MNVKGKELFNYEEVNKYVEKFQNKKRDYEAKVSQLQCDIQKLEADLDKAIEADILEDTAESKKQLQNLQARKANLQSQISDEQKKVEKIDGIMKQGLSDLLPLAYKQTQQDLATYSNTVERELFKKLAEARQAQEELLLLMKLARNKVSLEVFQYNELCEIAGMPNLKRTIDSSWHNHPYMYNRSFREFGSPMLQLQNLPAIESVVSRLYAEARSSPKHTLQTVDLQKFLDNINEDNDKDEE